MLDHLKPVPRKECEIERYFKNAEELDICFYKNRDEKTTVTQKGKQAPVKSATYLTAKIKRDKADMEVPIKTVLTDHYPNMGVTENQKIAGEPEFGEEPQDDTIEVQRAKKKARVASCGVGFDWLRSKVSTNKRRTKIEDYNLDLTYITNRIIACGFPAGNYE